jgi:hypothetical protein
MTTTTEETRYPLQLCVDKDKRTNKIQVSLSHRGTGFRLAGPKYSGASTALLIHHITRQEADRIRGYLDEVFPAQPKQEKPA